MTPVMIYSTVVAAPNGLEMSAALALWASMLGLTKARLEPRRQRLLLLASIPSAMTLAVLRSIGPLWLALILLTLGGLLGRSLPTLVHRHRLASAAATATVSGATALGIWWTRFAGTNSLANAPSSVNDPFSPSDGLRLVSLWFFQAIAAFPTRNEPAPTIVYVTGAILILAVLGAGLWVAEPKVKAVLAATVIVSALTPLLLTIATYSKVGAAWQGRYGLPFCIGALIISGAALDRRRLDHRFLGPIIAVCWGLMLVAHSVGMTNVLLMERRGSPLAGDPSWLMPEPWMIVVVVLFGFLSWGVALTLSVMRRSPVGEASQLSIGDRPELPEQLAR
jgi:hypothetical protein